LIVNDYINRTYQQLTIFVIMKYLCNLHQLCVVKVKASGVPVTPVLTAPPLSIIIPPLPIKKISIIVPLFYSEMFTLEHYRYL